MAPAVLSTAVSCGPPGTARRVPSIVSRSCLEEAVTLAVKQPSMLASLGSLPRSRSWLVVPLPATTVHATAKINHLATSHEWMRFMKPFPALNPGRLGRTPNSQQIGARIKMILVPDWQCSEISAWATRHLLRRRSKPKRWLGGFIYITRHQRKGGWVEERANSPYHAAVVGLPLPRSRHMKQHSIFFTSAKPGYNAHKMLGSIQRE